MSETTIERATRVAPAAPPPDHSGEDPALTYSGLRNLIGGAGFALPVVLLLTGLVDGHLEKSMSAYYYTDIGNYFTGTLCVIGVFLVAYRFGDLEIESILTTVAGIAALGVAFFHCVPSRHPTDLQRHLAIVHLSCAGVLFAILGLISFWFFSRELDGGEVKMRLLYQVLGGLIWGSIVAMLVWNAVDGSFYSRHGLLFWFETICVVSFSLSFTIKGRFITRAGQLAAAAVPALRRP